MGCRDKGAASCPPARPKAAGADRQELTSCRARPFGETPAALVEAGPSPQEMVDLGLARAPAEADPDRRGSDLLDDPHLGPHVARNHLFPNSKLLRPATISSPPAA